MEKIINEAINVLEKADIRIEALPRFTLARMYGNVLSLGESMYSRHEVTDDYYDTDTKLIG